ncbi:MAG TPA: S8 family serine peptidase [Candidatus Ozemobacteraceae bacterium]|nr:S8 family serine peptidase [Candidatus Ozemobacteraceae bacterium]
MRGSRHSRLPYFLIAAMAGSLSGGPAFADPLRFLTTREAVDSNQLSERVSRVPARDRALAALREEGGQVSAALRRLVEPFDAEAREIWAARGVSAHLSDGEVAQIAAEWPSVEVETLADTAEPVVAHEMLSARAAQPAWNHVMSGAWDLARLRNLTGKGVLIGVVGPDVPFDHTAIAGRIAHRRVFGAPSLPPARSDRAIEDLMLLHPLGILAGRMPDATKSLGAAPEASIALATVPRGKIDADALLEAIQWLTEPADGVRPAAILFAVDFQGPAPRAVRDALSACRTAGILPILPAGNNPSRVTGMAALPDVVTVGALDQWRSRASFSGCGPAVVDGYPVNKPDYMEPGLAVLGPASGNTFKQGSGTLQAAAHLAGLWAQIRQSKPDADLETLLPCLLATSRDLGPTGADAEYGSGIPDPLAMLQYHENPVPPGTPPTYPPPATATVPLPGGF